MERIEGRNYPILYFSVSLIFQIRISKRRIFQELHSNGYAENCSFFHSPHWRDCLSSYSITGKRYGNIHWFHVPRRKSPSVTHVQRPLLIRTTADENRLLRFMFEYTNALSILEVSSLRPTRGNIRYFFRRFNERSFFSTKENNSLKAALRPFGLITSRNEDHEMIDSRLFSTCHLWTRQTRLIQPRLQRRKASKDRNNFAANSWSFPRNWLNRVSDRWQDKGQGPVRCLNCLFGLRSDLLWRNSLL